MTRHILHESILLYLFRISILHNFSACVAFFSNSLYQKQFCLVVIQTKNVIFHSRQCLVYIFFKWRYSSLIFCELLESRYLISCDWRKTIFGDDHHCNVMIWKKKLEKNFIPAVSTLATHIDADAMQLRFGCCNN